MPLPSSQLAWVECASLCPGTALASSCSLLWGSLGREGLQCEMHAQTCHACSCAGSR